MLSPGALQIRRSVELYRKETQGLYAEDLNEDSRRLQRVVFDTGITVLACFSL